MIFIQIYNNVEVKLLDFNNSLTLTATTLKIKDFYVSCMDKDLNIEELDSKPLLG